VAGAVGPPSSKKGMSRLAALGIFCVKELVPNNLTVLSAEVENDFL